MSKALEIENLIFSYDNEKTILKGINLSVNEGSFTAIVGDNGAGKSTLMKLLIGELNQTEGFIKIFGDLNTKNNRYMDISYISQNSFEEYRHFPTTIKARCINSYSNISILFPLFYLFTYPIFYLIYSIHISFCFF